MSHSIKVSDEVYQGLETVRDKRETFSQVVERLLAARSEFQKLADILEGQIKFRQWQSDKLRGSADAAGVRE